MVSALFFVILCGLLQIGREEWAQPVLPLRRVVTLEMVVSLDVVDRLHWRNCAWYKVLSE